jgi:hypothetical protein
MQDTDHVGEPTLRERSLAMMIRRLCSRRLDGSFTINEKRRDEALALLRSMGLEGSPLRGATSPASTDPARAAHVMPSRFKLDPAPVYDKHYAATQEPKNEE